MCNPFQSFWHTVSNTPGDRVAQLICEKIVYPEICEVQALGDTERDTGGLVQPGVTKNPIVNI